MTDTAEIKIWEWCKIHGDYAGYLMRYPNGSFAEEARLLMGNGNSPEKAGPSETELSDIEINVVGESYWGNELRENEIRKEKDAENEAFYACRSIDDYEAFLKRYPNSKYAEVIKDVIRKREEREREKEEKERARREAWQKSRQDEDDLKKCKTKEDYLHFIETHPDSRSLKEAQSRLDALKAEPINLTLSLVFNVLCITAVIVGLCINNMKFIGLSLLICGILEKITHWISVKKWKYYWQYYGNDNLLPSSAIFMIITGAIVSFRMFIT